MRSKLSRYSGLALATATVLLLASSSHAAIIYGDFDDIPPGVVMYLDVTESSGVVPVPPPRYGAPTVTVNTMDFNPKNFAAVSTNGGADFFDGQLNFSFMTPDNRGLNSLTVKESGDFSLKGVGTAATEVSAGIIAKVEITHVGGVQLATPIEINKNLVFSADLAANPGLSQPWSNNLFIDFGPELAFAGYAGKVATKGNVVINDSLSAISEASTIAFIAKKDFKIIPGGELETEIIVPEPMALSLVILGLAGVGLRRRVL